MSDEKEPDEQPVDPAPAPDPAPLEVVPESTPLATGAPAAAPTTPAAPGEALVVVPPATLVPGGQPAPGQPGATGSRPPVPPTPIDYAMPTQPKSWLPTPQMIKNLGCIFKMLFGFTVLLILGYVMLMALNPKARQWALQGSKPGAPGASGFPGAAGGSSHGFAGTGIGGGAGPTPFKAVNQILAIPAQALGKTDDVVKANNARVGQLDGLVAEDEAKTKGSGGTSRGAVNPFASAIDAATKAGAAAGKPGAPGAAGAKAGVPGAPPTPEEERAAQAARMLALQEKLANLPTNPDGTPIEKPDAVRPTAYQVTEPDVLAPVTLPGGTVIRSASPAGTPNPTRPFFYWVVNANLSAINPPRMLLNGRLIHEGQEVNIALNITFVRFDEANKQLVFRDKTGAIVTRSY